MEYVLMLGKAALVAFTMYCIGDILVSERRNLGLIWRVWKRFRIGMFLESLGIFVLTGAIYVVLRKVPGLNYGWMNIFSDHGGNMTITPIFESSQSSSMAIRLIAPVFFSILFVALPFFAKAEEDRFRRGYRGWGDIVRQSIKFGFAHCWVGVSIGIALALIVPGLFFGYKYRREFDQRMEAWRNGKNGALDEEYKKAVDEAVMVTTTYHTMYNTIMVIVLLIITLDAV